MSALRSAAIGSISTYEAWALGAQWVGSLAALGSVAVAVVFGILTLANNRRSKDAQERATLVAAMEDPGPTRTLLPSRDREGGRVQFSVRPVGGDRWLLVNDGPDAAYDVRIDGLTALDKQRLRDVAFDAEPLRAGDGRAFAPVSRLTISGPANIVVSYRQRPDGPVSKRVLQVPSP